MGFSLASITSLRSFFARERPENLVSLGLRVLDYSPQPTPLQGFVAARESRAAEAEKAAERLRVSEAAAACLTSVRNQVRDAMQAG
ncbi:MAG: hypothetical protein ACKVPX_15785, partial [Myxococcaceae bacterium]